jgi:hypothetical protein
MKPLPDAEFLRTILRYEPETGRIFWKVNRRKNLSGVEAGCVGGTRRYRSITVNKSAYQAHRVAWVLFYGSDPPTQIDHINNDPFDNRIENLRLADNVTNGWNRGRPNTNASGYKGVCWHVRDKRWAAYIRADGKRHHLGNYDDPASAHAAYATAAAKLHGEFARVE